MNQFRPVFALLLVCLLSLGVSAIVLAQDGRPQPGAADPLANFPDLIGPLERSPGCLGVETARTSSGKNVIFAWFEDKEAAMRWYYNDTHQGVMAAFFPERDERRPLMGVPDDIGPIMAIASITFDTRPRLDETALPISQIAIELYTPVNGGIQLGGTFAPAALEVDDLRDLADAE